MIKRCGIALGVLGMFVSSAAWADRDTIHYNSITVFGDSLVDAGNYYALTGDPDPALGFVDHRFTNGYNYPDLLSRALYGSVTTPSSSGGSNFAFAAARIVDTGDPIPDLAAQMGLFQLSGGTIDPDGLYILNFGANDVFGALGVFGPVGAIGSYPDISSYLQAAALQYAAAIQALNDMGARNILATDFPLAGNPLTIEANGYLTAALSGLSLDADTDFFFYSLSGFNTRVLTDPAAFGLPPQRTDTNCIAENAQATGCEGIFFFDGIHPTAAIQAAGFADMDRQFGLTAAAVPEPATWAMLLLGFAFVGAGMRRARPSPVVRYSFG